MCWFIGGGNRGKRKSKQPHLVVAISRMPRLVFPCLWMRMLEAFEGGTGIILWAFSQFRWTEGDTGIFRESFFSPIWFCMLKFNSCCKQVENIFFPLHLLIPPDELSFSGIISFKENSENQAVKFNPDITLLIQNYIKTKVRFGQTF